MPEDLDALTPDELDDIELLLIRTKLRQQIAQDPKGVSPELSARYRALNDEVDKRARSLWS